jgi:hypothetical protein
VKRECSQFQKRLRFTSPVYTQVQARIHWNPSQAVFQLALNFPTAITRSHFGNSAGDLDCKLFCHVTDLTSLPMLILSATQVLSARRPVLIRESPRLGRSFAPHVIWPPLCPVSIISSHSALSLSYGKQNFQPMEKQNLLRAIYHSVCLNSHHGISASGSTRPGSRSCKRLLIFY